MKKKKKKIFQELFRLFQKGNKRNQKDTDMLHNSNTSFASAVATRSEIPGSLEHPQEPSQQQPMKVESLGVCESADQFGFSLDLTYHHWTTLVSNLWIRARNGIVHRTWL